MLRCGLKTRAQRGAELQPAGTAPDFGDESRAATERCFLQVFQNPVDLDEPLSRRLQDYAQRTCHHETALAGDLYAGPLIHQKKTGFFVRCQLDRGALPGSKRLRSGADLKPTGRISVHAGGRCAQARTVSGADECCSSWITTSGIRTRP